MDYNKIAELLDQLAWEFRKMGLDPAAPSAPPTDDPVTSTAAAPEEPKKPDPKKELALLQSYGRTLLTSGAKDLLLGVLQKHGLTSLSSAPVSLYPDLHTDLEKAIHDSDIPS